MSKTLLCRISHPRPTMSLHLFHCIWCWNLSRTISCDARYFFPWRSNIVNGFLYGQLRSLEDEPSSSENRDSRVRVSSRSQFSVVLRCAYCWSAVIQRIVVDCNALFVLWLMLQPKRKLFKRSFRSCYSKLWPKRCAMCQALTVTAHPWTDLFRHAKWQI